MLSRGFDPYKPASVVAEGKYLPEFLHTIDHALMFYAKERPQDIVTWTDMLTGKVEVSPLPEEITALLERAEEHITAGRLIRPANNNALSDSSASKLNRIRPASGESIGSDVGRNPIL